MSKRYKPGSQAWKERAAKLLHAELKGKEVWTYCSFAGESSFNGGAIIKACGVIDAAMKTKQMGINPGGELMTFPLPDSALPEEKYRNRLLTKKDILEFWADAKSLGEIEEEAAAKEEPISAAPAKSDN